MGRHVKMTQILLAAFALAVAAACGGPGKPAGPAEQLTIAAPSVPHTALLQIAAANGYFADEGLEVSLLPAVSGPQALGLVAQGKADLATGAEVVAALAIMKGADIAIVASIFSADEARIVARRDRGIARPADLAGKTVGVTFGTAGEYFLWAYLIRLELSPALVTFVNIAPDRIPEALAAGTVDAVATWQPIVLKAQAALDAGNSVSFSGDGSYVETHVVVGQRENLSKRPQAMAKLVRALLKAEQFNRSHPEQALGLVAGRLNLEAKELAPYWKDFTFGVELLQSQLLTLEDEARWAMTRGHVKEGPVPNFLPSLYLDALLAARPERVTVVR